MCVHEPPPPPSPLRLISQYTVWLNGLLAQRGICHVCSASDYYPPHPLLAPRTPHLWRFSPLLVRGVCRSVCLVTCNKGTTLVEVQSPLVWGKPTRQKLLSSSHQASSTQGCTITCACTSSSHLPSHCHPISLSSVTRGWSETGWRRCMP
jgi:hypothetical protein